MSQEIETKLASPRSHQSTGVDPGQEASLQRRRADEGLAVVVLKEVEEDLAVVVLKKAEEDLGAEAVNTAQNIEVLV